MSDSTPHNSAGFPPPAAPLDGRPVEPAYQHAPHYSTGGVPQNGRGVTALILGIVAVVLWWLPFAYLITALPAGIVAIVLGKKGQQLAQQGLATNRGQARAGVVLGIIGTSLCGLNMVAGAIIGALSAVG
jgi:hypothetical protein